MTRPINDPFDDADSLWETASAYADAPELTPFQKIMNSPVRQKEPNRICALVIFEARIDTVEEAQRLINTTSGAPFEIIETAEVRLYDPNTVTPTLTLEERSDLDQK